jgi:chemotaxis family two-component system sensor kinase Cph1
MNNFDVDLTNCDIEPIHILAKIQSHGFLIAVNVKTLSVSYISENIQRVIQEGAVKFVGKPLSQLAAVLKCSISGEKVNLDQLVTFGFNSNATETNNPVYLELDNAPYYLIIHSSGEERILEFEQATSDAEMDIQPTIGRSLSAILAAKSLKSTLENAAIEIKNIIRYDRVMVYRFEENGHGEIVAESKEEDLEPFLGLHYPASDIPKQARELYKVNLTRIIADVNCEPSAILASGPEDSPLDLTHSVLRAVSPIHIQYLKNMGVHSSFSISLMAKGELWGMIVSHNYSPRFINYRAREAAKLFGQVLSSALEYRQGEEDSEIFNLYNDSVNQLTENLEKEEQISDALFADDVSIKDITSSTGALLVFNNTITKVGSTPDDDQIAELIKWLKANMSDTVYYTHRFPQIYAPAKMYSNIASGIMACMLSNELGELIIWFKPEQLENVKWAGNPEKPVQQAENGLLQLSPRKSFETWVDIVSNTSEKWSRAEAAAVVNLREHIIYFIKRKANEIRQLNHRLNLAYEELNTFSYTVSHDLRTPLSSIKGYAEILLANNKSLDENAVKIVNRIKVCADKMALLIKEILRYSSVGKADLDSGPLNMTEMIKEIQTEIIDGQEPDHFGFIMGETPVITGDRVMIKQVFANIIGNAVKYSSRSNPSKVKIEGVQTDKEIVYQVTDNGIGIDEKYHKTVFELFKRMDNVKDFEGTGVGLAIVKRIMEKHNAKIWFESKLGTGTTFFLSFEN